LAAASLAAVFVTSLAVVGALGSGAEPQAALERPAVSSGSASRPMDAVTDAVPARSPAAPPVSEDAADARPSLVLPIAVVVAFGVLGVWFSRRQTSA
jgi:hypothetical protein